MGKVHDYLIGGGTKLRVKPRLVSNDIEKEFGEFEVRLGVPFTIKKGYLYNEAVIKDVRNIAPIGYHLPSMVEFVDLIKIKDSNYQQGNVSFVASGVYYSASNDIYQWIPNQFEGNNQTGMHMTPTGNYQGGFYESEYADYEMLLYSSYINSLEVGYFRNGLNWTFCSVQGSIQHLGMGCRFIKDDNIFVDKAIGNDGREYKTGIVGNKIWIIENSAETKFRNGDNIETTNSDISFQTNIPYRRAYLDNESNVLL